MWIVLRLFFFENWIMEMKLLSNIFFFSIYYNNISISLSPSPPTSHAMTMIILLPPPYHHKKNLYPSLITNSWWYYSRTTTSAYPFTRIPCCTTCIHEIPQHEPNLGYLIQASTWSWSLNNKIWLGLDYEWERDLWVMFWIEVNSMLGSMIWW